MSEEDKTLAPEQGDGTPQAPATKGQSSEQTVKPPEKPAEPETQEPQFMTQEDAQKLKSDILSEAQSYSDKGRVKLQQRMGEVEATIKNAADLGKPFTEEEQTELRQSAQAKAMAEPIDDTSPAQGQPTPEQAQYINETLYADSLRLEGQHGFKIDPTDPEVSTMEITGDPEKDKANQAAMFEAKAKRLASAPKEQLNTEEAATNDPKASVRAGATNTGNKPSPEYKDANDLWDRVSEERKAKGQ